MLHALLQGGWLGFSIAAPVGPIGVLVLRQSLGGGWRAGVASGLGAALADLIYGALAAAGVRAFAGQGRAVALAGGAILLVLAWRSWRERPAQKPAGAGGVFATFLLTLSNPMTILSFAAMVASVGAAAPGWFVAGVFLGSMAWWVLLSLTASRFAGALAHRGALLNRVAAVTLAAFGVWAICFRA
jgi:threonine/homoserine/homoserine lactone efflux protein